MSALMIKATAHQHALNAVFAPDSFKSLARLLNSSAAS
jgi:hypothetical protein